MGFVYYDLDRILIPDLRLEIWVLKRVLVRPRSLERGLRIAGRLDPRSSFRPQVLMPHSHSPYIIKAVTRGQPISERRKKPGTKSTDELLRRRFAGREDLCHGQARGEF